MKNHDAVVQLLRTGRLGARGVLVRSVFSRGCLAEKDLGTRSLCCLDFRMEVALWPWQARVEARKHATC